MKNTFLYAAFVMLLGVAPVFGQASNYMNYLMQEQISANGDPSSISGPHIITSAGTMQSPMAIDPGGAVFSLFTKHSNGTEYLLASNYVGAYMPVATMKIVSEDTTSTVARTRADRPFTVQVAVQGLRNGAEDPAASKSINFYHYVQSYGDEGSGMDIDESQATLYASTAFTENTTFTMDYELTVVPGGDRSKVRGEERFEVWSLEDKRESYTIPAFTMQESKIQIWPVADGAITGITSGELVRYEMPQLIFTMNDLYPFSTTYAQAYPGAAQLGVEGNVLPGSRLVLEEPVPQDRVLVVDEYGESLGSDGIWTVELITKTPFGIDRLAYVTFNLDRTMKVNGAFTTVE